MVATVAATTTAASSFLRLLGSKVLLEPPTLYALFGTVSWCV